MIKVLVEEWTCGDKKEVHFFQDNEVNAYVFGYNPKLMSEYLVKQILTSMGMELPKRN